MGDAGVSAFTSGLVAGMTSSFVFSPVDRALFLSHVHKRPFLCESNFEKPFQSVNMVMLQRVISSGLCFPLEDAVRRRCPVGERSSFTHNFVSGTVSGSLIAIVTNPLASITFQKWSAQHPGGMIRVASIMFQTGGIACFNRAIFTTLARDFIWGGAFSCLRHELPKHLARSQQPLVDPNTGVQLAGAVSFFSNVIAAAVATLISSPFNYARNLQYAHDLSRGHLSTTAVFRNLWREAQENKLNTQESRASFLARRLTIGWGTLRVSVGIAFSSQIYNLLMAELSSSRTAASGSASPSSAAA
mmetsp:Transcript_6579/g.13329  ORF Transcript_6579/g.13329 Transcript_6579/m.13329 type:complete len:302 (-) Transcript_6579:355-1260(-)|eukprot:CAMPEP_0171491882 /NCGR_PEP_ID=MMETSP0958-20121227/4102_1 /TAXON_ID=87120 /ORGANISM="Aurantiochytrium limacinum, Strain ATCCMYA-1381" /LENGTH=301 /DNA_ID=CAMNT_0012025341 /DNA_START=619 /DNA_END=1524 /DNA_ORIENTATION=+